MSGHPMAAPAQSGRGARGFAAATDRIRRSLIAKVTIPTVALVLLINGLAAVVLALVIRRDHEGFAVDEAARFAAVVQHILEREMTRGHPALGETLRVLCEAADDRAVVTDAEGVVRAACDESLVGRRLPAAASGETTRVGGRWVRHSKDLVATQACAPCHVPGGRVGAVTVYVGLDRAEEESGDQERTNLAAGGVMAVGLSLLLGLVQVLVVHRPLERLRATVDRIRQGDLEARAPVEPADELGQLGEAVNAMAASIEHAKVELERTHRAELVQAEKLAALGQLTSSVAHEIKNPLSGIIGALTVVERETPLGDPHKVVLGKVLAQVERLSQTAVSLLDLARPLRPVVGDVDVVDVLERTLFFVERQARAQKVELRRRYPSTPPVARVDPDLCRQVFLNLLLNAVQAMPRGGVIEVEVRPAAGRVVEVAIIDHGVGIRREDLGRIFSPFFTTKSGGTGLGLFVTRQILETQRGEIIVESEPGRGSVFTVRLPAGPGVEEAHATG